MKILMCIHHPIISPIKCLCSPSKAFEGAKIFTLSLRPEDVSFAFIPGIGIFL